MGMASSRSNPLPWGIPSNTSISTTSASSLAAIQWAVVAPTFPAPTIVTFLRILSLHRLNHAGRELAGLHLGGALHLPFEIVGYILLLNRRLHRILNQAGCLAPIQKTEHHDPGEHH